MTITEGINMKSQQQRRFRLIASVILTIIFTAYLSATAHAAAGEQVSISRVNGAITLAAGERAGPLRTVNGSISLAPGAWSGGPLSTVNGRIVLDGATVQGNIETVNADVQLRAASMVDGDIVIRATSSDSRIRRWLWPFRRQSSHQPVVEIGAHCEVMGTLHLHRPVELRIADTARVREVIHHYQ